MSQFDWIITLLTVATVALTAFSVLLIPAIRIMLRGAAKWTKTEGQVSALVDKMDEIVEGKQRDHEELAGHMREMANNETNVHREILEQMRVDRDATDRRLRFIEEFWMRRGQNGPNLPNF